MTMTAAQEGVISMQNYENIGQYPQNRISPLGELSGQRAPVNQVETPTSFSKQINVTQNARSRKTWNSLDTTSTREKGSREEIRRHVPLSATRMPSASSGLTTQGQSNLCPFDIICTSMILTKGQEMLAENLWWGEDRFHQRIGLRWKGLWCPWY